MYLPIPTWLVFLFLCIASFAPFASRRPGWWMAYHGALLVCWVLVSVAAMRRVARADRKAKRKVARMLREPENAVAAETDSFVVHTATTEKRLIIVARDEASLYDSIRRDQLGDETVRVITDRRSTARRLRIEAHIPDRRRGERRRNDSEPLLLTRG